MLSKVGARRGISVVKICNCWARNDFLKANYK